MTKQDETIIKQEKGQSLNKKAIKRFFKHRLAAVSLFIAILYVLAVSILPHMPFIDSPSEQILQNANLAPSIHSVGHNLYKSTKKQLMKDHPGQPLTMEDQQTLQQLQHKINTAYVSTNGKNKIYYYKKVYILGTDDLGRDMLSRVLQGGGISIMIGIVCALVSISLGTLVGALAAYVGGFIDYLLMRVVDILYSLPYLLLYVILMAIFGRNIFIIFVAISLTSWLTVARIVRGQIMLLKNAEFIEAARSMGASNLRIIVYHLLPNIVGVIVVFTALQIPVYILAESTLSFLGLGISAPMASWGTLINDGVPGMTIYPWKLFVPATAMVIFLFAMSFLGDGLRDAFDPQSRNEK